MWTAEWKGVIDDLCDEFNKSQDKYEVIPLSIPSGEGQADSKFLLAVAGGDPPDVIAQWTPVIPKWVESRLILPLDDMISPADRKYFDENAFPVAKKLGMYQGKIYGLPTGVDIQACYYMTEHFRQARLDPNHFPKTLEELAIYADKLNRYDDKGRLTRVGFLPSDQSWNEFVLGFGRGFYDFQTGKLTIDTPGNLAALRYLAEQRRRLGWGNVQRFQAGMSSIDSAGAGWPFITGAYSIVVDGQWRVEQIAKYAPGLEYKTAPLPPPLGGNKNYGWGNGNFVVIPRGARHKEGAYEFCKFFAGIGNPKRAAKYAIRGGWLPVFRTDARSPEYLDYLKKHPQFKTFVDLMDSEWVQPSPPIPYQVFFHDNMDRLEERVLRGIMTPEQAIKELAEDIQAEKARRREFGYHD
jgi:multiple sugar transport system substrate-binding protein